jgi:GntR family transcriptional regulator
MLLSIDLQSESPIYTQLVHQIIEGIARKQLTPGEPLPSVRSLASDLGINLHTVNKAYQLLKQDGYVQIHRQKGAIIQPDSLPVVDDLYIAKLREQLRPLIAESVCKQLSEEEFMAHCKTVFQQFKA